MRAQGEAVHERRPLGSGRMDLALCDNSDHAFKDHGVTE